MTVAREAMIAHIAVEKTFWKSIDGIDLLNRVTSVPLNPVPGRLSELSTCAGVWNFTRNFVRNSNFPENPKPFLAVRTCSIPADTSFRTRCAMWQSECQLLLNYASVLLARRLCRRYAWYNSKFQFTRALVEWLVPRRRSSRKIKTR